MRLPRSDNATLPVATSIVRCFTPDYYHTDALDALAVADALGLDTFDVMGWSDGANSAVLLAAAVPSRVSKLVIFGGNHSVTAEDVAGYEATRDVANTWSKRMRVGCLLVFLLFNLCGESRNLHTLPLPRRRLKRCTGSRGFKRCGRRLATHGLRCTSVEVTCARLRPSASTARS